MTSARDRPGARLSSRRRRIRPPPATRQAIPLYDLDIAARPIFWVAALAGIIVFGSLMGAMFIGQQYLQNVLGYSTFEAGAAIIPAALAMVVVAPRSAVSSRLAGLASPSSSAMSSCLLDS